MTDVRQRGAGEVDQPEVPHERDRQEQDVVGGEGLPPTPRAQAGDLVPHDRVEARVAREAEHAGVGVEHRGVVLPLDEGHLHVVVEGVPALGHRPRGNRQDDGSGGDDPGGQDGEEQAALGAPAVGARGHALALLRGHHEDAGIPAVDHALGAVGRDRGDRGGRHDRDPAPGPVHGGLDEPVDGEDEGADRRRQRHGPEAAHTGGAQDDPPDAEESAQQENRGRQGVEPVDQPVGHHCRPS